MKKLRYFVLILMIASILTACGSKEQNTASEIPAETGADNLNAPAISRSADPTEVSQNNTFNYEYEGALSNRLLLAFGSLKLAETDNPITVEQAPQMLILWQAFDNLTRSGTSAEAEVEALISQIEQSFTSEQVLAINDMALTQVDIQTWAQENGITLGSGTGTGTGTGQGMGQGSGMTAEQKATKQAENNITGSTGSGEGGLSSAITEALITYLEGIK